MMSDGFGLDKLVYNRNGQTNEVVGFDGDEIDILTVFDGLGTTILAGAAQMDTDQDLELVFVEHTETAPDYNPRIVIFDGSMGNVDYDTGPGPQNNYNVAGFNWTTMAGFNINTGLNPLFDVDNNGRYEMAFNINGSNNVLIGWDLIPRYFRA